MSWKDKSTSFLKSHKNSNILMKIPEKYEIIKFVFIIGRLRLPDSENECKFSPWMFKQLN